MIEFILCDINQPSLNACPLLFCSFRLLLLRRPFYLQFSKQTLQTNLSFPAAGRREFRNLVFSAVNLWPGKIASLNPEVGQNTALHVSRTATNFRCSIFLPYVHSTSFFSKPFPVKHKATCDQSSESAFTCVLMIVFRSCIVSAAALSPVNHKGLFQG